VSTSQHRSRSPRAYREGARAYRDGRPHGTCPYFLGTLDGNAWEAGWEDAERYAATSTDGATRWVLGALVIIALGLLALAVLIRGA